MGQIPGAALTLIAVPGLNSGAAMTKVAWEFVA